MELTVGDWYDVRMNLSRERAFDNLWTRIGRAISALSFSDTVMVGMDGEEQAEVKRVLDLVRKARPR